MLRTRPGFPKSRARYPVVVKMPVPIMLETTSATQEIRVNSRRNLEAWTFLSIRLIQRLLIGKPNCLLRFMLDCFCLSHPVRKRAQCIVARGRLCGTSYDFLDYDFLS